MEKMSEGLTLTKLYSYLNNFLKSNSSSDPFLSNLRPLTLLSSVHVLYILPTVAGAFL